MQNLRIQSLARPSGRRPLIIAHLLTIIKDDLKIGTDWNSGATCDDIAKRLYPQQWKSNEYKAKAKTRITIGRLRKLIPQIYKQLIGVPFPLKLFPFYSSKPIVTLADNRRTPFGGYKYFFHMDADSLEIIRERMQTLSDALEEQAEQVEKFKEEIERERNPERKVTKSVDEIESIINEMDEEQRQALIQKIKKKYESK